MGLFFNTTKKDKKVKVGESCRCYLCGKKIKRNEKVYRIDGEIYCESCGLFEEEMIDDDIFED